MWLQTFRSSFLCLYNGLHEITISHMQDVSNDAYPFEVILNYLKKKTHYGDIIYCRPLNFADFEKIC